MTDIQKRFDRILAIFMYLQAKPLVTAGELAVKYDVSLRTIYRDIRSLISAGVPIYGEAGAGYALVQGYKLPPMQFTKQEALSLVAAEKLMLQYTDPHLSSSFTAAVHKMKAILQSSQKSYVALADDTMLVRGPSSNFNEKIPEGLSVLMESIVSKKQVIISYRKPSQDCIEERSIEPVGIFEVHRYWYVMAYCLLRNAYRQFRLDRIQHIRLSDSLFSQAHRELSYYLDQREPEPTTRVVFRVQNEMARYLHWDRQHYGFLREELDGGQVIMHFDVAMPLAVFARWLMMFVDQVDIIEPEELKHELAQLLANALEKQQQIVKINKAAPIYEAAR